MLKKKKQTYTQSTAFRKTGKASFCSFLRCSCSSPPATAKGQCNVMKGVFHKQKQYPGLLCLLL